MVMDTFSASHFHNEDAARKALEALLWPSGPVCPHCGVINHAYTTNRPGVFRCAEKECRKDFSVTMKTVMERSHIKLHKWLQAFHLMCSSKKRSEEHTSELQSLRHIVCRLLLEKKKTSRWITVRRSEAHNYQLQPHQQLEV